MLNKLWNFNFVSCFHTKLHWMAQVLKLSPVSPVKLANVKKIADLKILKDCCMLIECFGCIVHVENKQWEGM